MAEERLRRESEPKNYAFEYRSIMHVAVPRIGFSEDDHKEEVIAKYKKLDNKVKVLTALEEANKKIEELEAAAKPKVVGVYPSQFVHAGEKPPEIEPETPQTIGKGVCPTCNKFFKRLDMHICASAAK